MVTTSKTHQHKHSFTTQKKFENNNSRQSHDWRSSESTRCEVKNWL